MDKKEKIKKLYDECMDYLVERFFDPDSDKLLDEKVEVLTELNKGTPPAEIPKYYDVLEKYPKDGEMWD